MRRARLTCSRPPGPHAVAGTVGVARCIAFGAIACAAASLVACGLSLSGLGSPPLTAIGDASIGDSPGALHDDGGDTKDGSPTAVRDSSVDMGSPDASPTPSLDSGSDAPLLAACSPIDAGLSGAIDLSTFTVRGTASYNENGDGRITLTNSETSQAGAAWAPEQLPAGVSGIDLTWAFRVGPDDTAGDGVAFAVLAGGAPGVGAGGDGVGLQSIAPAVGGPVLAGYAVDMDMYQNTTDMTDIAPNTLKLVAMPAFAIVAETAVPPALNDGNSYTIDVAWRAPSTLTATLHGPNGQDFTATSNDPRLAAPPMAAWIGFTGATGGISDSHNEISSLTFIDVCK